MQPDENTGEISLDVRENTGTVARARLDLAQISVEDGGVKPMRYALLTPGCVALMLFLPPQPLSSSQQAQGSQQGSQQSSPQEQSTAPKNPAQPSRPDQLSRLTVEVSGGDENTPVENASVYIKYVQEHAVKKNKTIELNVKTNQQGIAHVAEAPLGRALLQIVADGWKTYGRWYDISEAKQTIKVHLDKPPKWY